MNVIFLDFDGVINTLNGFIEPKEDENAIERRIKILGDIMDFNYLYIPIGVPTFHLESAQKEFDKSVCLLKDRCEDSFLVRTQFLGLIRYGL